jgi:hypothetical protein
MTVFVMTSSFASSDTASLNSGIMHFTIRERVPLGTHWKGCWMGPRAGLEDIEKRKFLDPPRLDLRPHGRRARTQSLYRLRYRGSPTRKGDNEKKTRKLINCNGGAKEIEF